MYPIAPHRLELTTQHDILFGIFYANCFGMKDYGSYISSNVVLLVLVLE